jgi:hypothetical protein
MKYTKKFFKNMRKIGSMLTVGQLLNCDYGTFSYKKDDEMIDLFLNDKLFFHIDSGKMEWIDLINFAIMNRLNLKQMKIFLEKATEMDGQK